MITSNLLFGVSLTASFLAGVLALFAPCCITFLFPSYLGTIFKESRKVVFYTIIFALGLSFILIPIALGFRFAIFFLDMYHREVYYFGAAMMIFMGFLTIKPVLHLPQFLHVSPKVGKDANVFSVFGLGLMSGITSACCAPVLFAAITLTALSPSLLQALIVSIAYVAGIVFPLFLISLFYEKAAGVIGGAKRQEIYEKFKYVGAAIFFISGILVAIFNYMGKIDVNKMEPYSQTIRMTVFNVAKWFQNPIVDLGTFLLIVLVFYLLLKKRGQADE